MRTLRFSTSTPVTGEGKNHIFCLRKDDVTVQDPTAMEELATDHFTQLLGEPAAREFSLNLEAVQLPSVDTTSLELPLRRRSGQQFGRSQLIKHPGPTGSLPGSIRFVGQLQRRGDEGGGLL
jgi:hypothetical protein